MLHPLIRNRLAVHLQVALLSSAAFAVPVAYAAEPAKAGSSASVQQYNIGAGSLTEVLSRFASQAGVALSFDAAQTNGRQSKGLQGAYSVDAGFATLLAGSGLQASNAGGSYVLGKTVDSGDALELGATSINASGLGETTEGSGSYTTGAVTIGKGQHSLRETPQSVTVLTRKMLDDQNDTIETLKREVAQITAEVAAMKARDRSQVERLQAELETESGQSA